MSAAAPVPRCWILLLRLIKLPLLFSSVTPVTMVCELTALPVARANQIAKNKRTIEKEAAAGWSAGSQRQKRAEHSN